MSRSSKLALVSLAIATGCASVPQPPADGPLRAVAPRDALAAQMQGSQVRWGGTILRVETKQHETCFQVLAFALRDDGAPDVSDAPEGRFVACAEGFYEPAVYRPERRITVVGVIGAPTSIKVGDYETQVPTVTVGRIKLWPRRPPVMTFYGEPWPGAWAAPWYPFVW